MQPTFKREILANSNRRPQGLAPRTVETPTGYVSDFSLTEFLASLWRSKWTLLVFCIVGGAAALAWSVRQKPVYQATTSIELMELNENFMNRREVDPTASSSPNSSDSYLRTQMKVLRSESLLERVARKLNLEAQYENRPEPGRTPAFMRSVLRREPAQVPPLRAAVEDSQARLGVQGSSDSRVLEITYESPDPAQAAQFLNTLVAEYTEQSLDVRWQAAQHTGEWLAKQLAEMKGQLEGAEHRLQDYSRNAGLLITSGNENVAESTLRRLQDDLEKAQTTRMATQANFDLLKDSSPQALQQSLDDVELRDNRIKLADLQRRLANLDVTLTAKHPSVRELQAEIAAVEEVIKRAENNLVNRIRNEHFAALAKERMLTRAYERQTAIVSEQAGKTVEYNILKREAESSRQLYDSMLQKVKEAGVASAIRANNIRVLDPAVPPTQPARPRTTLNVLMGLTVGFFCGLVTVAVRHNGTKVFKSPADITECLGVSELGVIPASSRSRFALSPLGARDRRRSGSRSDVVLATRREHAMASGFQSALLSILFSDEWAEARALTITSPSSGDGKTTAVCNLGIALAELRRDVLLIDGDLRRPRLHEIFGCQNTQGLMELLAEDRPLDEIDVESLAQETNIPGLYLLPAGVSMETGLPHAFVSARLDAVLGLLRDRFAAILIDTPPVLQFPDARVFARHTDGTILIVRANQTEFDWALAAQRRLRDDGSRILGTILNDYAPAANKQPYVVARSARG